MSEPIFRIKLYEEVANHILERIRSGEWSAGCRLPAEGQLAKEFDVSRSTIREAIRSLQMDGILRSKAGSGTYVSERASVILETRELAVIMGNPAHIRDLVQSRFLLEPQLAALAAGNASAEEKAELMEIVERMREKRDRSSLMVLGHMFHLKLARMSGNLVLSGFYQSAESQLRSMRVLESLTLEIYLEGVEEHRAIAVAVAAGDAVLAKRRMREHLEKDYAAYLDIPQSHGSNQ